jgi:hypothetical protein
LKTYRNWISGGVVAIALAELIVLGLRAAAVDGRAFWGPFLISIHSVYKPLWIGLGASIGLLVLTAGSRAYRALAFALMAFLIAAAIAVLARTAPAIVTKSDIAVTELYIQLATRGDLLLGPYSRFGWHHPGPMYFWLQVPFYAVSGQRGTGLYAGALALNLASLAVLAWMLRRVNRGLLSVTILGAWLLFAWRDRFTVASPWTGHIPILATMTFVGLAAAVASGRRWMFPLVIVFGSFVTQAHVALVPLVVVLSLWALAGAVVNGEEHGVRLAAVLQTSAWLLAALWLLPIAEELAHTPGNLTRLWRFFVTNADVGQSFTTAFAAWTYALVGVLRPDLYTPYGGHLVVTHLLWGIPVAVAEVIALGVVGVRGVRARRLFEGWLALTALVASLVSLWSITRIQADIVDHEIYWVVPLGAMNLAIVAAAGLRAADARWFRNESTRHAIADVMCTLLVLACVGVGFRDFDRSVAFETASRRRDAEINATYQSIRGYLDSQDIRKPLFRVDGKWDMAAAVFVRLNRSARTFAVDDAAVPMFTDVFSAHGDEDAVIAIGAGHLDRVPDVTVLQREPVYVDAFRTGR